MHDEQGVAGHARNSARRSGAGTPALSVIRPDVTPAERLLAQGAQLRFRAPELALVLGERAAALAEAAGSEKLWVNAEGLSVFARMRMGQRADVVHRAVTVLRTAEADGHAELAAQMRVALAVCARSAGVPITGLAAGRVPGAGGQADDPGSSPGRGRPVGALGSGPVRRRSHPAPRDGREQDGRASAQAR